MSVRRSSIVLLVALILGLLACAGRYCLADPASNRPPAAPGASSTTGAPPPAVAPISLEQCLITGVHENLDIKQQQIQLQITTAREEQALAEFYPVVSLLSTDLYEKSVQVPSRFSGPILTQHVFSGGKLTNDFKAAQEKNQAQYYTLQKSKLTIENSVLDAYLQCLRDKRHCIVYADAVDGSQRWIDAIKADPNARPTRGDDLLRWTALHETFQQLLVAARNDLANAKILLNTLINAPASTPLDVKESQPLRVALLAFLFTRKVHSENDMLDILSDYAMVFEPGYKTREKDVLVARHNLLAAKGALLPSVDFITNYSTQSQSSYNNWNTGFYMNFDVYKQPKFDNVRINRYELDSSQLHVLQYVRDLRSNLRTLYNNTVAAHTRLQFAKKQEKSARLYLTAIEARYMKNNASNLDVVEGFQAFYTNQIAEIDATYTWATSFASLYLAAGFSFTFNRPTPEMFARYREHGLMLDYHLKALDDPTFQFMDSLSLARVESTFLARPELFQLHDRTGTTALLHAVERGNLEEAAFVLQHGADPNATDDLGRTPLMQAVCVCPANRRLSMVDLLIKSGADIERPAYYFSPLHWAVITGDEAVLRRLLAAGASPDVQDANAKMTPLHLATYRGSVPLTNTLLEYHANPWLLNGEGLTPCDMAWELAEVDLVRLYEALPQQPTPSAPASPAPHPAGRHR